MAEIQWRITTTAPRTGPLVPPSLRRLAQLFLDWETWLTLALTLGAVVSVAATVEASGFTRAMPAITLVSVLAVIAAMALGRTGMPMAFAWPLAVLLGALTTFWQTLEMVRPGSFEERLDAIYFRFESWFHVAFTGGINNDPLPFNVLLLAATWLGVFLASWSIFRWHNAWLGLIPGGIALSFTLVFIDDSVSSAALLYVLFGFLLVMRTNLMSRIDRWRREGVSYPPLLSLTILHFSLWAVLSLMVVAWIAPVGPFATPGPIKALVSVVERIGTDFVRLAGPLHVKKVVPVHSYTGILPFQGSIKLGERELLQVQINDPTIEPPILLRGAVYDEYTSGGWKAGMREEVPMPGQVERQLRQSLINEEVHGTLVPVTIKLEAKSIVGAVLFTPGQPVSSNIPVKLHAPAGSIRAYVGSLFNLPDDGIGLSDAEVLGAYLPDFLTGISVERDPDGRVQFVRAFEKSDQVVPDAVILDPGDRIRKGQNYRITGFVPDVSPDELRAAGHAYPPWVVNTYRQLPDTVPREVHLLALQIVNSAGAETPYDIAKAIEDYLRTYPVDYRIEETPPGEDTVNYFLFEARRGYFDYHASAMVVMLRGLGVPSRLAVGFVVEEEDYDESTRSFIVRDRNTYAWPEVYFPGYGWIPFNPTQDRPSALTPTQDALDSPLARTPTLEDFPDIPLATDPSLGLVPQSGIGALPDTFTATGGDGYVPWTVLLILAFAGLLAGAAMLGWQRSVAGLPYSQQVWEKTVRMASWAGHPPRPGETPTDFAGSLQKFVRDVRGIPTLAVAYNKSRFGRYREVPEEEEIRTIWPHLRGALVRRILRRPLRRRGR